MQFQKFNEDGLLCVFTHCCRTDLRSRNSRNECGTGITAFGCGEGGSGGGNWELGGGGGGGGRGRDGGGGGGGAVEATGSSTGARCAKAIPETLQSIPLSAYFEPESRCLHTHTSEGHSSVDTEPNAGLDVFKWRDQSGDDKCSNNSSLVKSNSMPASG